MPVLAPVVAAVSSALVAAGATVAAATLAAQIIVTVGLVVGSTLLSRLLSPRQKPPGQEFEVKFGANTPLGGIYGRQKVAGHIMPAAQKAKSVIHVRNIGVGWHDALEAIIIDGQRLRFVGIDGQWSNAGASYQAVGFSGPLLPDYNTAPKVGDPPATPGLQATGPDGSPWVETVEFGGNVRVKFYDGRPSQNANPDLTAHSQADASGAKHWTENHRGNSVCRVLVEISPDQNKNLSANPQIEFIVRGRRLWDPRKDPAYGGTGGHSRTDPATWEWSDNAALAATDYRLGLWLNGVKVFGIGTPIARIRIASRIAAANACDAVRPLLGGKSEPMWRIAAYVANERTHRDNLQIFMDAMAGWETERGGTYRLTAGGSQVPVVAITDADLAKAPARYRARKPLSERYNGVEGRFADPFANYELQDLPMRVSSTDEAEDMGERRLLPLTLSQVPSETQGQHLMEIARRRQRLEATATITLPPRLRDPEIMDSIAWVSAWHGGTSKQFQITNPWKKNRNMSLTWGLTETSASIWDWDPNTDQLSRLTAADLPAAVDRIYEVAGFGVSSNYEVGEGGQRIPVFIVTWTPIADQTVDAIVVKFRPVGALVWASQRFEGEATLASGTGKISAGIQADTPYEFEADLVTSPARFTRVVTPSGPVTSDPNHVVKRAVIADYAASLGSQTVDWAELSATLQRVFDEALASLESRAQEQLDQLAAQVQGLEQQVDSNRFTQTRRIESTTSQTRARLTEAVNVLADADSAAAERLDGLEASVDNPTTGLVATRATLTNFQSTQATVNSATSSSLASLAASLTALDGTVSGNSTAIAALQASTITINGTLTTQASQIASLQSGLTTANGNISANAGAIAGLTTRMTSAEGNITTQSGQLVSLTNSLTTTNGTVAANSSAISSLQSGVASINGTLSSYASQLTSLNAQVGSLSASVTTIANATVGPSGTSAAWAVLLNANGRVAGVRSMNNGTTASFGISADVFTINRPSDGATMLGWDGFNNVLTINNATFIAGVLTGAAASTVIDLNNNAIEMYD